MATRENLSTDAVKKWIEEHQARISAMKISQPEDKSLDAQSDLLQQLFEDFNLEEKTSEIMNRSFHE